MQSGVRVRLNPLGGNQLNIREALRLYLPQSGSPSESEEEDDQLSSHSSQPRPRSRAVADDYDYDDDFIDDGDADQPEEDDKQEKQFVGFGGFWVGTEDNGNSSSAVVDGNRLGNVILEKLPNRQSRLVSAQSMGAVAQRAQADIPVTASSAAVKHASSVGGSASASASAIAPQAPLKTKTAAGAAGAAGAAAVAANAAQLARHAAAGGAVQAGVVRVQPKPVGAGKPTPRATIRPAPASASAPPPPAAVPVAQAGQKSTVTKPSGSKSTSMPQQKGAATTTTATTNAGKSGQTGRPSKARQTLQNSIRTVEQFCATKFVDKKVRLSDAVMQDHLHTLLRAAISAGEAKLYSDIAREKRVVALSDDLWSTLNKTLRTKRASVETLGHALIWSARERSREKEVSRVEEVVRGYLQKKRGDADAVRVEWNDELCEMLYVWFGKKKELLAARNQLGSRVKSVKKSVNGWVTALKKNAFQGFSVAEEEIIKAFRGVEEKNKAKKRKREEERAAVKKVKKAAPAAGNVAGAGGGATAGGAAAGGEVIELD